MGYLVRYMAQRDLVRFIEQHDLVRFMAQYDLVRFMNGLFGAIYSSMAQRDLVRFWTIPRSGFKCYAMGCHTRCWHKCRRHCTPEDGRTELTKLQN